MRVEKQLRTKEVKDLYQAILKLRNTKECEQFLRDLLTLEEIEEASRRWQVAKMLARKIPFSQIEEKTDMSTVTIARINRWLHHGAGGYKLMLERLKEK